MIRRLGQTVLREAQVMSFADGFIAVSVAYGVIATAMLSLLVLARVGSLARQNVVREELPRRVAARPAA